MNINDLKRGYLVKFREEGYGIVSTNTEQGKIIVYQDCSYDSINDWNGDFTDKKASTFDIVAVYKPKGRPNILSVLNDYELIWNEENLDELSRRACEEIRKKYKLSADYKYAFGADYIFKFDYGDFNFITRIMLKNYSLEELIYTLSDLIEAEIISFYKR